ncbi:MAG: toprim domain-containing protein [Segetibacter sp.]
MEALEPTIKVIAAKPLTNPTLCLYLQDRKIPVKIAEKYCKEVDFELSGKRFFAIRFENKSGGFELRNQHYKGSNSPKDVTLISFSTIKKIAVFEGFISFLSYQTLHQKDAHLTNFLVLNSLSFFEKSPQLMEENQKVYLYLDKDEAGVKNTQTVLKWNKKYVDRSLLYRNDKNLNDYLLCESQKLKPGLRLGRHL